MQYSEQEVLQYVAEDDVKFIRMAFCDVFGKQKNISIMPAELPRVFRDGIAIDGSAVAGFSGVVHSDLILHPDPATLSLLPCTARSCAFSATSRCPTAHRLRRTPAHF